MQEKLETMVTVNKVHYGLCKNNESFLRQFGVFQAINFSYFNLILLIAGTLAPWSFQGTTIHKTG